MTDFPVQTRTMAETDTPHAVCRSIEDVEETIVLWGLEPKYPRKTA